MGLFLVAAEAEGAECALDNTVDEVLAGVGASLSVELVVDVAEFDARNAAGAEVMGAMDEILPICILSSDVPVTLFFG